ncbi:hypothetical protein [uncultured Polaribacter sp.]|uniref:hypothetical protein n=1 Tax=uncultured Polaribacter sp. TaxID=174711 RepID=UPI0030D8EBB8|tara:strand:- start:1953 stop:2237 length:285 start_codon:yes stop_codon:yes gene_type:complete
MFLASEHINEILIILVPVTLMLILWFFKNYQELKAKETKKLHLLNLEFASEKKLFIALQNSSKELKTLELKTHYKLLKIKVDLLNIDFSLKEII